MLESFKLCISSHLKKSRKFLAKLNCFTRWKRRKTKTSISSLLSSFSSMDVSTQLKQVFKLVDSNGDGKISPLELKQILLSLGQEKAIATKEAEGMVREMDCNGDGFVDLDEFMNVMEDSGNGICKESDIKEAFRVFDADNNGLISAKELKRILGRLGYGECSIKECKKMIKGVDMDGDGFVNFEEFKCMMMSS